ncbi:MAG: pentapeptide repeat-containing protein, partial [Xenococcaceae cyanobacterium]
MSKNKLINYNQILLIALSIVCILVFLGNPVAAAAIVPKESLTLEILQKRIETPIQSEGLTTIDLSKLTIDLSSRNLEVREQFYQQLQNSLNRSKTPLGIDFSDSQVRGDFQMNRLGLQTSLTPEAISSLLTPLEQQQLQKNLNLDLLPGEQISSTTLFRGALKLDRVVFSGKTDFDRIFFLQKITATNAIFGQEANWNNSRFARKIDFDGSTFERDLDFSNSIFFGKVNFQQIKFVGIAKFNNSIFEEFVSFERAKFKQVANFDRSNWSKDADFKQVNWSDRALFSKNQFLGNLWLDNSTIEKSSAFRSCHFQ